MYPCSLRVPAPPNPSPCPVGHLYPCSLRVLAPPNPSQVPSRPCVLAFIYTYPCNLAPSSPCHAPARPSVLVFIDMDPCCLRVLAPSNPCPVPVHPLLAIIYTDTSSLRATAPSSPCPVPVHPGVLACIYTSSALVHLRFATRFLATYTCPGSYPFSRAPDPGPPTPTLVRYPCIFSVSRVSPCFHVSVHSACSHSFQSRPNPHPPRCARTQLHVSVPSRPLQPLPCTRPPQCARVHLHGSMQSACSHPFPSLSSMPIPTYPTLLHVSLPTHFEQ